MKNILFFLPRFFSVSILTLIFAKPVLAYLDPGTGSYVFQMLIAALVGGIFVIKQYFFRIKQPAYPLRLS